MTGTRVPSIPVPRDRSRCYDGTEQRGDTRARGASPAEAVEPQCSGVELGTASAVLLQVTPDQCHHQA